MLRILYLMATPNTYYFSKHDDYETRCPLPILADGKLDIEDCFSWKLSPTDNLFEP